MTEKTLQEISQWMDEFLWPDPDDRQGGKRRRILEAATDLFVRHGYRKTSIDDVARQAGVAKGTVYLYYRNKAELAFHAVALEKRAHLERLAPILDPGLSPVARLRSLIVVGLVLSHEMPLVTRFTSGDRDLVQAMQEVDTSLLARINDWQTEFIMGLLDDASDRSWSRDVLAARAQVLVDVMFAIAVAGGLVLPTMPVQTYAETVAGVLVDGVLDTTADLASLRPVAQPVMRQGARS